jgi:TPR repeat protein
MNDKDDFALVRKASNAVEKAKPRAKHILSGMIADTLALAIERRGFDEELQRAADAGDIEAQFKLGQIHFERRRYVRDQNGKLVKDQNWEKEVCLAAQWFRKAADQGHVQAQCEVAICLEYGWGVEEDRAKAFDYLRLAGASGCSEAWEQLGRKLIYQTIHTKFARQEGVECMRKAAETGNAWAAVWLSKLYSSGRVRRVVGDRWGYVEGIEVLPDAAESTRWLRCAAENQDATAQFELGQRYEEGCGVSKDITKAAMWYRRAAEALSRKEFVYDDEFGAARSLARCYTHGCGVSKDLAEAYMWLKFGAEVADDEDAKTELDSLCGQMSQSELTVGKNRYQRFQQIRKEQFGES